MTLDQDDINAIADEVLKRLKPYLCASGNNPVSLQYDHQRKEHLREYANSVLRMYQEKRDEEKRLDSEIQLASEKMPPELRPHPDQYKSMARKKQVLEMLKDKTRWQEVPGLSRQWIMPKKAKLTDTHT